MEDNKKIYILVNRRLAPIYASVQGGHALAQYILKNPVYAKKNWNNQTLIYLTCRLDKYIELMDEHGYYYEAYQEPDFNNTITACAVYGDPDLLFVRLKTLQ